MILSHRALTSFNMSSYRAIWTRFGQISFFEPNTSDPGPKKYEIWSEMGPYGSVGAHIKTGKSSMAQDHFKTPPDPKKGHGMTKNPQKDKKYSRVGRSRPWRSIGSFMYIGSAGPGPGGRTDGRRADGGRTGGRAAGTILNDSTTSFIDFHKKH